MELFLALAINQSSCVHKAAAVILLEAAGQEKRLLLSPDQRLDTRFSPAGESFPLRT